MPWGEWALIFWQAAAPALPVPNLPSALEQWSAMGTLAAVLFWLTTRHDAAISQLRVAVDRLSRALTVALIMYHQGQAELAELRAIQDEIPKPQS